MKYKKKYLRLIGKLTGGITYIPSFVPQPYRIGNHIRFPQKFIDSNAISGFDDTEQKKRLFQWRHTLDICKDASGTGSLNRVISILDKSQLFWINNKSPLNLDFGQPNSSASYKTQLEYFEQTILDDVKKFLNTTPWIKTTQFQAQQLKYSYDKSLWECGRSPRSYIHQTGFNFNIPTKILSTFAGYMDPLEKDAPNPDKMEKYPEGRFEYTLDENDMTLLGFKDCKMSINGKYDFPLNWDQVGFEFTFKILKQDIITIKRSEGLKPNRINPNRITISYNNEDLHDLEGIDDLVLGNNKIAEELKKIGGNLELKLTYILIKLLGDWGQVIFYFIIKKLIQGISVILTTCDMVVYCLCITLGLECIYNAKNNNFPNDIRQSGSKDLVLYKPALLNADQIAFVNFKSKLQEIYNHNHSLANTIKALMNVDLSYQGTSIIRKDLFNEFIDGIVEDIEYINTIKFFNELADLTIDLDKEQINNPNPDIIPPNKYSTIISDFKKKYECINIFIIKGKQSKNLTIRSGKTSYTLKGTKSKSHLKIKMDKYGISCEAKHEFRQIFHTLISQRISGGHGKARRPPLEYRRRQYKCHMDDLKKHRIKDAEKKSLYHSNKMEYLRRDEIDTHILFQTDVNFDQFKEDETLQETLRNNMNLLIKTIQDTVFYLYDKPDYDIPVPYYEKTEDNNIIILEDWVISKFIYCVHSNLITDFDVSSKENIWTSSQAQYQLESILDDYFVDDNEKLNGAKAYYNIKVTEYKQKVSGDTLIGGGEYTMIEEIGQINLIKEIYTQQMKDAIEICKDFLYETIIGIITNIKTIFEDFLKDKDIFNSIEDSCNLKEYLGKLIEHLGKLLDEVNFLLQECIRFYLEKKLPERNIIITYEKLFSDYKDIAQDELSYIMSKLIQKMLSIVDNTNEAYNFDKIMELQIATYFILMFYKKNLFIQENIDLDLAPPRLEDFMLKPEVHNVMDIES